jgi:putative heme-binding domain-containing protein
MPVWIHPIATILAVLGTAIPSKAAEELSLGVRTTDPLSPTEQRTRFQLPPGFEIQLVTHEPDIHKPMNLAFDAIGRLWVTTSIEYPWAAPTNRVGRDRLMIFEDFGPDGRARKVTRFADGLNIPIGVYPFRTDDRGWKAVVWSIPNLWLLEDTDGDGAADRRTVLYGPFDHTRDTHGNQASFRRGFDGWLYATHGFNNDSHVTARDGSHVDLNSGNTYRIRLDGSRIEHHTHGQVNPFGLTWDPRGNLYSSDCHTAPLYQLLAGGWYPSFGKPDDGLGFAPVMLEHAHGSTAIDGASYYTDDLWPESFRDTLFIGNVMTSRLNRDSVTFIGSTPKATEQPDFLTSTDPWFRPVDTLLGPDGALYIADFYNRIIGHYEVPLTHPGRDRERGRIWRVVYRGEDGKPRLRNPALPLDLTGLVAELASPSLGRRLLASAEIQDRIGTSAVGVLKNVADTPRNAAQRVHALWLLQRLGAPSDSLVGALTDPDPLVRTHGFRMLAERPDSLPDWTILARRALATDPDALVRRCAAEALGAHPQTADIPVLLEALAAVPAADTHLRYTIRKALRDSLTKPQIFQSVISRSWSAPETLALMDVALAVRSRESAAFLVAGLDRLSAQSTPTLQAALQHASLHAAGSELPGLVERIRAQYRDDLAMQGSLFAALEAGQRQRGGPLPKALQEWGVDLVAKLLTPGSGSAWRNVPHPGKPTADPWAYQERSRHGGGTIRVLSSIGHGEQLTGILRSPVFEVGPEVSFWLCGHDGYPDQPAGHRNAVRLLDAESGEMLFEATAPRNDVAQRMVWDTSKIRGKRVRLEVVDGDTADAYAWIAVGEVTGLPALPERAPRSWNEQRLAAIGLAERLKLEPTDPAVVSLMSVYRDPKEDLLVRAAALRLMQPALRSEADFMSDPQIPESWRQLAGDAATSGDPGLQKAFLQKLWREAPQRVQVRAAKAFASQPQGVREFTLALGRGEVPVGVLRDASLRDALLSKADETSKPILMNALQTLPPVDEERVRLMTERRSRHAASKADAEIGRKVFEQNCRSCHQLGGQGGLVGPQLTGVGNRGVERLCEDVLDPNQNVDHAFRQTLVTLVNGDTLTGLFRREQGNLLVFADATGKEFTVAKSDVAERRELPQSLMPDNFGETIPEKEFQDLLAFLIRER